MEKEVSMKSVLSGGGMAIDEQRLCAGVRARSPELEENW